MDSNNDNDDRHHKYHAHIKRVTAGIIDDKRRDIIRLYFSLFLVVLGILFLIPILVNFGFPAAWESIFNDKIIALFITVIFAFCVCCGILFQLRSHFLVGNNWFACPECGEEVDVYNSWKCGWCGNTTKGSIEKNLIIQRCTRRTCAKEQNAFQCPYCKNDIVLDVNSYNSQQDFGMVRPGLGTFIKYNEGGVTGHPQGKKRKRKAGR